MVHVSTVSPVRCEGEVFESRQVHSFNGLVQLVRAVEPCNVALVWIGEYFNGRPVDSGLVLAVFEVRVEGVVDQARVHRVASLSGVINTRLVIHGSRDGTEWNYFELTLATDNWNPNKWTAASVISVVVHFDHSQVILWVVYVMAVDRVEQTDGQE